MPDKFTAGWRSYYFAVHGLNFLAPGLDIRKNVASLQIKINFHIFDFQPCISH